MRRGTDYQYVLYEYLPKNTCFPGWEGRTWLSRRPSRTRARTVSESSSPSYGEFPSPPCNTEPVYERIFYAFRDGVAKWRLIGYALFPPPSVVATTRRIASRLSGVQTRMAPPGSCSEYPNFDDGPCQYTWGLSADDMLISLHKKWNSVGIVFGYILFAEKSTGARNQIGGMHSGSWLGAVLA